MFKKLAFINPYSSKEPAALEEKLSYENTPLGRERQCSKLEHLVKLMLRNCTFAATRQDFFIIGGWGKDKTVVLPVLESFFVNIRHT